MAGQIQRSHPVPQTALHQSRLGEIARTPWPAAALSALSASNRRVGPAELADAVSLPISAGPASGLLPFTWRLAATVGFATSSFITSRDWYLGAHSTCVVGLLGQS